MPRWHWAPQLGDNAISALRRESILLQSGYPESGRGTSGPYASSGIGRRKQGALRKQHIGATLPPTPYAHAGLEISPGPQSGGTAGCLFRVST